MVSLRRNVWVISTTCILVVVGVFAVLEMTNWSGGSYVVPAIGPVVVAGGFWWHARTRTLSDADKRPTDLEASQEIVASGLSEAQAMDLAVRAMLEVPHARLVERGPQMSWCRIFSFLRNSNEFCVANIVGVAPTRLRIRSRPVSSFQYVDWGKNRRNVQRIVDAMRQLHPELGLDTTR